MAFNHPGDNRPEDTARAAVEARIRQAFPPHPYIQALLEELARLQVVLAPSAVPEQWLYHPRDRVLTVWLPDLQQPNLSFLLVMLTHELGHILDFDRHPERLGIIQARHWSQVPLQLEEEAFVQGFRRLQQLHVFLDPEAYAAFIQPPLAQRVLLRLQQPDSLPPEPDARGCLDCPEGRTLRLLAG